MSPVRVYVPATGELAAAWWAAGAVPAGSERYVAVDEAEDSEYAALCAAADASAALLGAAGRRVVIVAEVEDADASFSIDRVDALQADVGPLELTGPAEELPELGWFATQEIAELLD